MTDRSMENIKRLLNQLNALLLASGENIFLSKELNEKLREVASIFNDSGNKVFQILSEKIRDTLKEADDYESPKLNQADISHNIKVIVTEIEKVVNNSSYEQMEEKTSQNGDNPSGFITVSEDDYELYEDFITESREHLQNIEEAVINLENSTEDKELINSIFRSFHTIKGNSAFLNLKTINVLAHKSENLLDSLRNNKIRYSAYLTDIILEAIDLLKKMLISLEKNLTQKKPFKNEADIAKLVEKIEDSIFSSLSAEEFKEKSTESVADCEVKNVDIIGENEKQKELSDIPDRQDENVRKFVLLSDETDKSFLPDFITECKEYVDNAETALLELEFDPKNNEAINTIFRAFHTIKGTSSFLGIKPVAELSHKVESFFIPIRDGKITFTEVHADLALKSIDLLKELVQLVQNSLDEGQIEEPSDFRDFLEKIEKPEEVLSKSEEEHNVPKLGEILLGEGKITKEDLDTAISAKSREPIGVKLIKTGVASVNDVAKAIRKQRKIMGSPEFQESSVRVRTDRLDRLIDMVGELVISHSMVVQDSISLQNGNSELQKKVSHSGKIVRELQDLSLVIRMVPMRPTFQKMARLVRDLSRKSGKPVNFITHGDETEIDRNMVDIINDPLVHLLRNAVDHGIENKEKRIQRNKQPQGTVILSAYHSGGSIVIEIKDDGGGLDRKKIVEKAKKKRIIKADSNMTDSEIFNLIFEPGFSTAGKVTDVSGRGVGLDVVKKGIESLRGKINILSEKGRGCSFIINLPLTMAITDGMLIKVGSQRFVIPTINISMSFRPEKEMLSTISGNGEIINVRDRILPLFRLAKIFGIPNAIQSVSECILIIVNDGHSSFALAVDELLGQQQLVAKSLGGGLIKIPAVSGGAILADGEVGLILDPYGIHEMGKGLTLQQSVL